MSVRTDFLTWLAARGFTPNLALTFEEGSGTPQDNYGLSGESVNGSPTWGTNGTYGPFWKTNATGDNENLPNNPDLIGTTKQTVLIIIRKTDGTNRQHSTFSVDSGTAANRCNAHLPWNDGIVYWDFGGATAPNRISQAWTRDTTIHAWAFRAGPAGMVIRKDGAVFNTTATANTGRTSATTALKLNAQATVANGDLQEYYFIAYIPDEVSDAVLASFTVDNVLLGVGTIQATASVAFTSSASLKAPGTLDATGDVVFGTGQANLTSFPPSRVTQVTAEVLTDGTFMDRVTQVTAEVITSGTFKDRVTQVAAEVISDGEFSNSVTQLTAEVIADVVAHSPQVRVTQVSLEVICKPNLVILTPSPLPDAFQGDAYSVFIITGGGLGAITFAVTAGTLPAGLTLNASTGEISGTPSVTGSSGFTVTATDSVGTTAAQAYTLEVTSIVEEPINLGIGPLGWDYTIQRGVSGVECHFEFVDVGLGSSGAGTSTYLRSQLFFPRSGFPTDQKFYLEIVGSNVGASAAIWTVAKAGYSQTLTIPAGQSGRFRNVVEFAGAEGIYKVTAPMVAVLNDSIASSVRIVAPLRGAQKYVSEIRLTNAGNSSAADQTIGGPDLFRTSSPGHDGLDDGWVQTNQPVFKYYASVWEHISSIKWYTVAATAAFADQPRKWSEFALVDIDDIAEFKYTRKVILPGNPGFLTPTWLSYTINATNLRDGHRYQVFARSVKPDGFFSFNSFLHTSRIDIALNLGNSGEIYNRCAPVKRVYMPGFMTPQPQIYFQIESSIVETQKLRNLGASAAAGSTVAGPGTDINATGVTSVVNDSVRTGEIGRYLIGGHDYEASASCELVYRFGNAIRRPPFNYMF